MNVEILDVAAALVPASEESDIFDGMNGMKDIFDGMKKAVYKKIISDSNNIK